MCILLPEYVLRNTKEPLNNRETIKIQHLRKKEQNVLFLNVECCFRYAESYCRRLAIIFKIPKIDRRVLNGKFRSNYIHITELN